MIRSQDPSFKSDHDVLGYRAWNEQSVKPIRVGILTFVWKPRVATMECRRWINVTVSINQTLIIDCVFEGSKN